MCHLGPGVDLGLCWYTTLPVIQRSLCQSWRVLSTQLHGELGPIKMVRPCRLLDPDGFQDSMRGIPADLIGASVNAVVDGRYIQ